MATLTELGFKSKGYLIPYHDYEGNPILDNGKPFYRVRLDEAKGTNGKQKYDQLKGTKLHLYIPKALKKLLKKYGTIDYVVVVEGEKKANALCEAGIPAVGIGGFQGHRTDGKLIPELEELIKLLNLKVIFYLGDTDTSHNSLFAKAAVDFANYTNVKILLPRIPLNLPKGIDDVKAELADKFADFWTDIAASAIEVRPETDAQELALALLRREAPHVLEFDIDNLTTEVINTNNPIIIGVNVNDASRYGRINIKDGFIDSFSEKDGKSHIYLCYQ